DSLRSCLTSPPGSFRTAAAIRSPSTRLSRLSAFSAAGRTSTDQPEGSVSQQVPLCPIPRDARSGVCQGVGNYGTFIVRLRLVVVGCSQEVSQRGILGALKEDGRRVKRSVGEAVDEL